VTTPSQESSASTVASPEEPLFARVVCGIDGSQASLEAARQAALLAVGGELRLVSVTWTTGAGPTEMTALAEPRARASLEAAGKVAKDAGARADVCLVRAPDPADTLLAEASQVDLAVVGTHGRSRRAGITIGSVATRMLHRAAAPVLVARRPLSDPSLSRVLLASDGSRASFAAAELAARIAGRFGSHVTLLRVSDEREPAERHALAVQAADLLEATGARPVVVELDGKPAEVIVRTAEQEQTSLVVVGSRGLAGVKALGSVSERVAHTAPCSVLVARPPR
jgi:nucleotide-binding universal stress UspA family protein